MWKAFCDECKAELTNEEVRYSLDMTGKLLCSRHAGEYVERSKDVSWKYEKEYNYDWGKHPKKDRFGNTPIICPHCRKESGITEEGIRYLVIYRDITCKNCGEVVIRVPATHRIAS